MPLHAVVGLASTFGTTSGVRAAVAWDSEVRDIGDWWDGGNPSRLTVPDNVRFVRVSGNVDWDTSPAGTRNIRIAMNGSTFSGMPAIKTDASSSGGTGQNIMSGPIAVQPGDDFELEVLQDSGGPLDVSATSGSWFAIEEVM